MFQYASAHFDQTFSYDRTLISPGILHLGVGAFHRAHMAAYVDTILSTQNDWGIIGASLRRPDTKLALAPQDFCYTLATRDKASTRTRLIGSVLDILDAHTQRAELLAKLADPRIRIVSLTVTEKGYCYDPSTGDLDENHPEIVHDLARPDQPVSAPGLLVHGLLARWRAGIAPFTVLSCDNLPANGQTTARIVSRFAALRSPELASHISRNVAFPSSMVDRIVPPTTDADRKIIHDLTNVDDAWPVVTEPFSQWVLEDRFPNGRPAFERVGVQLVDRVEPFERMKLRILNGAHSALAYLGYLAGHDYVADVMRSPAFAAFIHALINEEIIPTLDLPGEELGHYRDSILTRFANPALKHRTWQIAMDGSQKLPQRLLATIRERLDNSQSVDRLALSVAGWMRYVTGIDERGRPIDVRDPLAGRFRKIADQAGRNPSQLVAGLLSVREIFGDDLPRHSDFRTCLIGHVGKLFDGGADLAIAALSS